MWSTASEGFHSAELSSHILTSRGRSFANEIEGGSGTLCFEKWSTLPLPSLRDSSGPGVDVANVGGRSWDAVACGGVAVEGGGPSLAVALSTTCSPRGAAAGPGPSMTVVEDEATPVTFPSTTAVTSAVSWACNCRICSLRSGLS